MGRILLHIVLGLLFLALQEAIAAQCAVNILLCDGVIVLIVLHVFFSKDNKWLFIEFFILGFFISEWSGRPPGFDSLLYSLVAFFVYRMENIVPIHTISVLILVIGLCISKFIFYMIIGYLLSYGELITFVTSLSFLYATGVTFGVTWILYMLIKIVNQRYNRNE